MLRHQSITCCDSYANQRLQPNDWLLSFIAKLGSAAELPRLKEWAFDWWTIPMLRMQHLPPMSKPP